MQGDMKVLTFEYAQKARMARFALSHLSEYECLVLECLEKRQKLFVWRADYVDDPDKDQTGLWTSRSGVAKSWIFQISHE